ncbi:MAB_1171c family putative transporter, partial [Streptomyces sp. NPDC005180]
MLSAVLAVVLGLTLVWLARLLIRDRSNRLLRAVFLCIGCAALSYPFGTPGGVRFADGAVGDGTAKFTQNAFLLCAVYFLMCFFVHAASDRETAVPHTRRALVPLGATLLVIALATWATPAAERGHTYATADMRTVPVACFYLVAGLYLAYALAVALVWSVRYARGADRPLATGL